MGVSSDSAPDVHPAHTRTLRLSILMTGDANGHRLPDWIVQRDKQRRADFDRVRPSPAAENHSSGHSPGYTSALRARGGLETWRISAIG